MAIDPRSLTLSTGRLSGSTPSVFSQIQSGLQQANQENDANAARKAQLEQQKAQFEQQRQMQEAQNALQRQRLALDKATADRQAEDARKAAKRKDDEEKLAISTKFSQLALSGDRVGAEAMLPEMEARGMHVAKDSEENGVPVYRVYQSAAERAKEDAEFARRQRMASVDQDILPDSVSIQRGGTVVDLPGAQARRSADTEAVLTEHLQAYPEGDARNAALASARAALRMPGSSQDQLKTYDTLQQGPATDRRAEMNRDAQLGKAGLDAGAKNADARKLGRERAATAATNFIDVKNFEGRQRTYKQVRKILENDDPSDDYLIAGLVADLTGQKGALSDQDVRYVLGEEGESWYTQAKNKLFKGVRGGLSADKRGALLALVDEKTASEQNSLHGYLDNIQDAMDNAADPREAEGLAEYRDLNLSRPIIEGWRQKRGDKSGGPTSKVEVSPDDAEFDSELERLATERGLNPAAIRNVISKESGGKASAKNPNSSATGLIQFLERTAESLGTSTAELKKMSRSEQLPFVMQYLSQSGVTKDTPPEDYYVAIAAPAFVGKPNNTPVYREGTAEYDHNKTWDVDKDGVITVGNLKAWAAARGGGSELATIQPKNEADARVLALMQKAKGG